MAEGHISESLWTSAFSSVSPTNNNYFREQSPKFIMVIFLNHLGSSLADRWSWQSVLMMAMFGWGDAPRMSFSFCTTRNEHSSWPTSFLWSSPTPFSRAVIFSLDRFISCLGLEFLGSQDLDRMEPWHWKSHSLQERIAHEFPLQECFSPSNMHLI